MQEGWHTYWENPGDSGSPFEAIWKTNTSTIVENVQWPTPVTIPYPPLMTYGYEGDIIFPFKVFRSMDEDLSKISVDVDFLICADICIPEQASLTLDLTSINPDPLLDIAIKNLPTKFIQTHSTLNGDQLQVTFTCFLGKMTYLSTYQNMILFNLMKILIKFLYQYLNQTLNLFQEF